jgi:hypothetical protein
MAVRPIGAASPGVADMTKKDFEAIARAMYRSTQDFNDYASRVTSNKQFHTYLCYSLSDALAESNPRFDRYRFLRACGVEGE